MIPERANSDVLAGGCTCVCFKYENANMRSMIPCGYAQNTPLLKSATGKKLVEVSGHMPLSAKHTINTRKIRISEHSTKFEAMKIRHSEHSTKC